MTITDILRITDHRPWKLPSGKWKYYQEWNNAIFLHWPVDNNELGKFVPEDKIKRLKSGSKASPLLASLT